MAFFSSAELFIDEKGIFFYVRANKARIKVFTNCTINRALDFFSKFGCVNAVEKCVSCGAGFQTHTDDGDDEKPFMQREWRREILLSAIDFDIIFSSRRVDDKKDLQPSRFRPWCRSEQEACLDAAEIIRKVKETGEL